MRPDQLTPLERIPAFEKAWRDRLAPYWIGSAEEFVQTVRYTTPGGVSGRQALQEVIGCNDQQMQALIEAAGRATSAADLAFDVQAELRVGAGVFVDTERRIFPAAFDVPVDLPPSCRLPAPAGGWPVQYQGARNTCVAFALVALYQQLSGDAADLSEQFLFWATKERDGLRDNETIRINAAFATLKEDGVCAEAAWPYIRDPEHAGRLGPPPPSAIEAPKRRIEQYREISADNLNGIKAALAAGHPVLLAMPIYPFWTASWPCRVLGRVRPPMPAETRAGKTGVHALCAVGYVGDAAAPGQGYFIVRNSWGDSWGRYCIPEPQGEHLPGYGLIPFDLVYKENWQAIELVSLAPGGTGEAPAPPEARRPPTPAETAPADAGALAVLGRIEQAHQEIKRRLEQSERDLAALRRLLTERPGAGAAASPPLPAKPAAPARADTAIGAGDSGRAGDSAAMLVASNGINVTTGRPLRTINLSELMQGSYQGATPNQSIRLHRLRLRKAKPTYGMCDGLSYADLRESRWALVVHADDSAKLIEELWPLIELRCKEMGLAPPPKHPLPSETCRVWLSRCGAELSRPMAGGQTHVPVLLYQSDDTCSQWLARHGVQAMAVDPRRGVPFYLLIAGRPGPIHADDHTFIPFSFQYELDLFWGVGRVCFTTSSGEHDYAGYAAYAGHLDALAKAPPALDRRIVYFATRHQYDQATELSHQELVMPLLEGITELEIPPIAQAHHFDALPLLGEAAKRARLLRVLNGEESSAPPALLFAAVHGAGMPTDDERLSAHQGALICADWSGVGSVARDHWLAGEDLTDAAHVRGMVVFSIACYGIGCPELDQFTTPGETEELRIAPRPIVGQLPQQLLRRGALAMIGHVDRAWPYSFRAADGSVRAQTQSFADMLGRAMGGKRLGFVTDQFNTVQAAYADTLTRFLMGYARNQRWVKDRDRVREFGRAWSAYQDARSYVIFGDPAVRLPFYTEGDDDMAGA